MKSHPFLVFLLGCVVSTSVLADDVTSRRSPIAQPYRYLSGGTLSGPEVKASPDPLVRYIWNNPRVEDSLQVFVMHPVKADVLSGKGNVRGLDAVSAEQCAIQVTGPCSIRLDFGVELPAWIEMDCADMDADLEMGISEYNVTQMSWNNKQAKPIRYGNTYRLELNKEFYEGVRFGFLHFTDVRHPFTITSLRAVSQTKPANYTGSFDSDNDLFNRVWYVGAYDVRANQRMDCFGAILIDRGDRISWTGDAYPAQAASLVAFSNYDEVFKNLHWTESHPNGIESYELYWVSSLVDYYMYSGDKEGFRELLPKAMQRVYHAWDIFDNPTNLAFNGWDIRLGQGFDNPDCKEGKLCYQMQAIATWKQLAAVLQELGKEAPASELYRMAEGKTRQVCNPEYLSQLGLHASANAIKADLLPNLSTLYHRDFSDRLQRNSFSPFNQYFLLQAMAHAGHYQDAFASVRDVWGGQVEYGASCFFEVYHPELNKHIGKNGPIPYYQCGPTSLAHPWGAGVTSWLTEEMLGVKPLTGGFSLFSVKPHFSGFATRVSGSVNTPHGVIRASSDMKSGVHTLCVPSGCRAQWAIPKEGLSYTSITLDGKQLENIQEDADFVYLPELSSGEYRVQTFGKGKLQKSKKEQYVYTARVKKVDRNTHGDWYKKYGRDGYFIVGGGPQSSDLQVLPSYVKSITFGVLGTNNEKSARTTDRTPLDPRATLPIRPEADAPRVQGCYYSQGCSMCPVHITLKEEKPYTVAVYFADCDKGGRDLLVEAFDMETQNRITPSVRLTDITGGVYLVYTYHRSITVQANHVRGDNAVINALFFGD